jgi:hypothetical protein
MSLCTNAHEVYGQSMRTMAGRARAGVALAMLTLVILMGFGAGTASAGVCPPAGHSGTEVCNNELTPPNEPVVSPEVDVAAGGLPLTGADVLGLVVIGSAAVLTGTVLVRTTRRSPHAA